MARPITALLLSLEKASPRRSDTPAPVEVAAMPATSDTVALPTADKVMVEPPITLCNVVPPMALVTSDPLRVETVVEPPTT